MSIRQLRRAHVTGFVTLLVSLAVVTSALSARAPRVQAKGAAQSDAHIFVPTRVALPTKDEEAAPTF
jgi:hypothetical protein